MNYKLAILALLVPAAAIHAAEFHVSVATGDDSGEGTAAKPFKSIMAAAHKAMPGDTITVQEGAYRERVDPPRGGESDAKRITYHSFHFYIWE